MTALTIIAIAFGFGLSVEVGWQLRKKMEPYINGTIHVTWEEA